MIATHRQIRSCIMTARPVMPGATLEPGLKTPSPNTGNAARTATLPHSGHAIMFEALEEFYLHGGIAAVFQKEFVDLISQ